MAVSESLIACRSGWMMDAGHIFGRLEGPGLCFMSTDPSTANRPLWRQGTALFAGRRCAVGRWAGCCRALKMKTGDPATHTQWLGRSDHGGVASNLPQYTGRSAAPKSTRPRVMRRSIAAKFMLWLRQWGSMVNPNPSLLPTYTLGTRRDKKKKTENIPARSKPSYGTTNAKLPIMSASSHFTMRAQNNMEIAPQQLQNMHADSKPGKNPLGAWHANSDEGSHRHHHLFADSCAFHAVQLCGAITHTARLSPLSSFS